MSHALQTKTTDRSITVQPPPNMNSAVEPAGNGRDRATMIAEAAYYLAQKRNFLPGCELDDWLAAERQVGPAEQLSAAA